MRLFDSHTHLQLSEFDNDTEAVLQRARQGGLCGLLILGIDPPTSEAAIALAETQPGVLAAAGCHPHSARVMDGQSWEHLAALVRLPQAVAVGEIGLDFYRDLSRHETQVTVLSRQLELAEDVGKPVAVHCREAHETLLPIIETWSRRLGGRLPDGRHLGIMHYFSGDLQLARRYVELGFLISIHCSVTYPTAQRVQEVARSLPVEALVVETDSPYGPPQSRRGQRNEPAFVVEAAAKVAELRGEPLERVADVTTDNALRLLCPARQKTASTDRRDPDGD